MKQLILLTTLISLSLVAAEKIDDKQETEWIKKVLVLTKAALETDKQALQKQQKAAILVKASNAFITYQSSRNPQTAATLRSDPLFQAYEKTCLKRNNTKEALNGHYAVIQEALGKKEELRAQLIKDREQQQELVLSLDGNAHAEENTLHNINMRLIQTLEDMDTFSTILQAKGTHE